MPFRRSATTVGVMTIRQLRQTVQPSITTCVTARADRSKQPDQNAYHRSAMRSFSSKDTVSLTYIDPSGEEHPVQAEIGKHLLDVAHDNNIELEGACGGELACSTCHLVFEQEVYDTLPPKSDEEEDMLDLAMELTETSRLGCQIRVTKDFEGIKLTIPDDGY